MFVLFNLDFHLVLKFSTLLQDVQSRVSDVVMRKEKVVEEMDPEYEKLKNYVVELEDHLTEAQRHSMRLVKRQRGIRILSALCQPLHFLQIRILGILHQFSEL